MGFPRKRSGSPPHCFVSPVTWKVGLRSRPENSALAGIKWVGTPGHPQPRVGLSERWRPLEIRRQTGREWHLSLLPGCLARWGLCQRGQPCSPVAGLGATLVPIRGALVGSGRENSSRSLRGTENEATPIAPQTSAAGEPVTLGSHGSRARTQSWSAGGLSPSGLARVQLRGHSPGLSEMEI